MPIKSRAVVAPDVQMRTATRSHRYLILDIWDFACHRGFAIAPFNVARDNERDRVGSGVGYGKTISCMGSS
jgi:hypothetical protein